MKFALAVVLVLVLAAAVWAARAAIWPLGPCSRCKGRRGHGAGSTARAWNKCGRCGGSGERIRPGARTVRRWIGRPL